MRDSRPPIKGGDRVAADLKMGRAVGTAVASRPSATEAPGRKFPVRGNAYLDFCVTKAAPADFVAWVAQRFPGNARAAWEGHGRVAGQLWMVANPFAGEPDPRSPLAIATIAVDCLLGGDSGKRRLMTDDEKARSIGQTALTFVRADERSRPQAKLDLRAAVDAAEDAPWASRPIPKLLLAFAGWAIAAADRQPVDAHQAAFAALVDKAVPKSATIQAVTKVRKRIPNPNLGAAGG